MSFTIHGVGISDGIAIGKAQLVSHAQFEVAHYDIPESQVESEQARFDAAFAQAHDELSELADHIPADVPRAEFEASPRFIQDQLVFPTLGLAPLAHGDYARHDHAVIGHGDEIALKRAGPAFIVLRAQQGKHISRMAK